jgi:hypothetical protein
MRIEIGPDGKIIGSRRVSPNGQVSGLSEFSGREVLVILPGNSSPTPPSPWGDAESITRLVGEQIREAYDRYRVLQETYETPWEATRSFMEAMYGARPPDLMAEVDRWVKGQVQPAPAPPPPTEAPAPNSRASSPRAAPRKAPRKRA